MLGGHCCKYLCAGTPTHEHGFADPHKWKQCGGEVFTIYAYGKQQETDCEERCRCASLRPGEVGVSIGRIDRKTFVHKKSSHHRNALMTVAEAKHLKCLRHNGANVTLIASSCHTDNVALYSVLIDLVVITEFSCS